MVQELLERQEPQGRRVIQGRQEQQVRPVAPVLREQGLRGLRAGLELLAQLVLRVILGPQEVGLRGQPGQLVVDPPGPLEL